MLQKKTSIKGKVIPYPEINISDCPIDMLSEEHAKEESRAKDRIPEGRDFRILAKTLTTDKIESWENVWYYVDYRLCMSQYKETNEWIYGRFVNFIKEDDDKTIHFISSLRSRFAPRTLAHFSVTSVRKMLTRFAQTSCQPHRAYALGPQPSRDSFVRRNADKF